MKEENKKIEKLDWEEIINSVGKPVYDKKLKQWRVIDGYKRINNSFGVSFTDNNGFFEYDMLELYFEEVE